MDRPLRLWQHRFWDHMIRNERDYENHFDYIHYNPVKHGLVPKPEDWSDQPPESFDNDTNYILDVSRL